MPADFPVNVVPDGTPPIERAFESELLDRLDGLPRFLRGLGIFARHLELDLARGAAVSALERAKRARTLSAHAAERSDRDHRRRRALDGLNEFRVDITPILTGAGILGLAVGFGAQTLVRDVLSGFFIILENQVRVGDVAEINGTGGLVEAINLRTIVLRDLEGVVHVFPNGGIERLANRTRDYSYYASTFPSPTKKIRTRSWRCSNA